MNEIPESATNERVISTEYLPGVMFHIFTMSLEFMRREQGKAETVRSIILIFLTMSVVLFTYRLVWGTICKVYSCAQSRSHLCIDGPI